MPIPAYTGKHDADPAMTPADRLATRFEDPADQPTLPETVIITFQDDLFAALSGATIPVDSAVYTLAHHRDADVAVVGEFGIGAPALGIVLEELIALGGQRFVIVGGCATLQPTVTPGDAVTVTAAIRDEGTSYHYQPSAVPATASPRLVEALDAAAEDRGLTTHDGVSWSTDGFYRETHQEIAYYADAGVLTVEMEVATLYAMAAHHNVEAGALLTPFDRLTAADWTWAATDPTTLLETAAAVAVAALRTHSTRLHPLPGFSPVPPPSPRYGTHT